jgi:hypothetical protein
MTMELVEGLALQSISAPSSVLGGTSFSIGVTLNGPATPQYGVSIGGSNLITVPYSAIGVPTNTTSGVATATAAAVNSATPVVIQATDARGATRTAKVTILPAITSLSLTPGLVYTGNPVDGTVSIYGVAGSNGATVNLTSDNGAAQVPTSVTVPSGQSKAQFVISTSLLASTTTAHISASYNGSTTTQTLTLSPAVLGSITPLSATVVGGTPAELQIKFKGDVGASIQISLTSSNPAVAAVPASVTIAKGGWTAYVNAKTAAVTTVTPVTITATYGGVSVTSAITVNP